MGLFGVIHIYFKGMHFIVRVSLTKVPGDIVLKRVKLMHINRLRTEGIADIIVSDTRVMANGLLECKHDCAVGRWTPPQAAT